LLAGVTTTASVRLASVSLALLVLSSRPSDAEAQTTSTTPRFSALVEGAALWTARNNVRIPPDTGTEFSLVDLIGSGPTSVGRVEVTAGLAARHELRFVYAPIEVSGSGVPGSAIAFARGTFAPGVPTEADYEFTSYRGTYRYTFYAGDRWQWQVGFTGFVRDARVALAQPGVTAEDTDVGFVPLAHLRGRAALGNRVRLTFEVDGTAAPQGRAFDAAAMADVAIAKSWFIGGGYRTVEGGADVDTVYNFSWLNAAVVRTGVTF
jgi:hypothetical protein